MAISRLRVDVRALKDQLTVGSLQVFDHNCNMTFTRITIDPAVCTGKPCIRGLRFPVARLLGLLAAGETAEQILKAYPYLEAGDIEESLRYAAFLAEDETIEIAPAG
ncbi:MAG TPA: DUF433 domain-containing protein [Xanthobacteraceae bacterium]|nr:DUF433 domain-containing protein [Xanthobacteraceae bacterium]